MPTEQQPTEVLAEPPLTAPAAPAVEEAPAAPAVEEVPAAPAVEEAPAAPGVEEVSAAPAEEMPAAAPDQETEAAAPAEEAAEAPSAGSGIFPDNEPAAVMPIAPGLAFQLGELWETGRKLVAAGLEKRGNPHGAELARVGADMMLQVSQLSANEQMPGLVTTWALEFLGQIAAEYDKRPELAQLLRSKAGHAKPANEATAAPVTK